MTIRPQRTTKESFLLDYDSEHKLDLSKYTKLASFICDKPMALINILDDSTQYIMAQQGLPELEDTSLNRCDSLCDRTAKMDAGQFLSIPDCTTDSVVKDFPAVRGDLAIRWYSGTPLVAEDGRSVGVLCIMDVVPGPVLNCSQRTALLQLTRCITQELELRAASNVALREKRSFLTSINNEIRNPLHGISMSAEMLRAACASGELPASSASSLMAMQNCVTSLTQILDHILVFNQYRSDPRDTETRHIAERMPINLVHVAESTLEAALLGSTKDTSDVFIDLDFEPELMKQRYMMHPGEFARILLNIFENALQHTKAGSVTVSMSTIEASDLDENCRRINLAVTDTGRGIAKSDLQGIFHPFVQRDPDSPGMGLGLTVAYQIVEANQGQFEVASEVGLGTTFTVTLDLQIVPAKDSDLDVSTDLEPLTGMRYSLSGSGPYTHAIVRYCQAFGLDVSANANDVDIVIAIERDLEVSQDSTAGLSSSYVVSIRDARTPPTARLSPIRTLLSCPVGPMRFGKAVLDTLTLSKRRVSVDNIPSVMLSKLSMDPKRPNDSSSEEASLGAQHKPQLGFIPESMSAITAAVDSDGELSPSSSPSTPNCLVVDDNRLNVKILSTFLTRRGMTCTAAYDGLEAIDAVESLSSSPRDRFDFIFMDINMPNMNGILASERIIELQAERGIRATPIIAVSGCSAEEARYAISSGLDVFFKKPVNLRSLSNYLDGFKPLD